MSYLQSTCKFVTKKLLNFIQQLIQIKQWQHFLKRRYKNQFEFIVEAVFKSQRTTFKLCCSIARFFLKYNSIIFIKLLHGAYLNLISGESCEAIGRFHLTCNKTVLMKELTAGVNASQSFWSKSAPLKHHRSMPPLENMEKKSNILCTNYSKI